MRIYHDFLGDRGWNASQDSAAHAETDSIYKDDYQTYVTALYQQILQEPSSDAFVSINMSGPTASSTEMILPNLQNQSFGGNHGILTLPNSVPTIANLNAADVWNKLINNYYGVSSAFANTDQPFIQEWNNTIDLYSQIFRGVTLVLTTTTDALPDFIDWDPTLLVSSPAPGFASDCGLTNAVPIVQNHQQQCAAVTWVLYHFANPTVGGNNAKAVFEAGMTAARDSFDLGTNGVKWLAADTSAGLTPLPDTPYRMSRMLGGLQFSQDFSPADTLQAEGCPTFPTLCGTAANPFTPVQGLINVLQLSYFPGTFVGPLFGAPASVTYGKWIYKNAPMNYMEIYDTDILYSSGLSNCSMLLITQAAPEQHAAGFAFLPGDTAPRRVRQRAVLGAGTRPRESECLVHRRAVTALVSNFHAVPGLRSACSPQTSRRDRQSEAPRTEKFFRSIR